ncbi:MAG: MFS transporter [Proteobacteria bacterium]|nr:MFS transporter [Pseudomonadota bacterium]
MIKDRPVIFLALAQTLVWAGLYYLFPALLVRWEQSLGWSKADLTAAITLAIFVSAFMAPFAGRLIDAGKGALMMAGSTLLGGLCLLALSIVTELREFYLVWSLIGVAMAGCLYEPCFALLTHARGANAKQAIILVTLVAGFASTISFPGAHALSEAFGWNVAIRIFAAVLIFIAAPLMWLGARAVEQNGIAQGIKSPEEVIHRHAYLRRPAFWFVAIGFSFLALAQGVTIHHLLPILYDRNIHLDTAIFAASFIGPMQVAGRLAMMAAERHVTMHEITIACFVMVGIAILLLFATATTPALLVGFVILFGAGHGIVSIVRPVIARELLGGDNFGAKFGSMALLYLVGSASAPFVGSLIWEIGGYDLVLPVLIALVFAGLSFFLIAQRLSRLAEN